MFLKHNIASILSVNITQGYLTGRHLGVSNTHRCLHTVCSNIANHLTGRRHLYFRNTIVASYFLENHTHGHLTGGQVCFSKTHYFLHTLLQEHSHTHLTRRQLCLQTVQCLHIVCNGVICDCQASNRTTPSRVSILTASNTVTAIYQEENCVWPHIFAPTYCLAKHTNDHLTGRHLCIPKTLVPPYSLIVIQSHLSNKKATVFSPRTLVHPYCLEVTCGSLCNKKDSLCFPCTPVPLYSLGVTHI